MIFAKLIQMLTNEVGHSIQKDLVPGAEPPVVGVGAKAPLKNRGFRGVELPLHKKILNSSKS